MSSRTIIITGTDTGVGKTVVTALCLSHLIAKGLKTLALKPFCSGERSDALLLWELQGRTIGLDEVNPYYFPVPISPWTAARAAGLTISLEQTIGHVSKHSNGCDVLLLEGAGGLLAPLGERFNAADLVRELGCEVIVVAGNRIGVLNHTLLTAEALRARGLNRWNLALSDLLAGDDSIRTNEADLRDLLPGISISSIPRLELRNAASYLAASAQLTRQLASLLAGGESPAEAGKAGCGSRSRP